MAAKEKKGLGTGLGVLFGEDTYTDENELKQLPVSRLEPRREQPRTVFDDAALQELAESLRRYGVIQPVTARKLDNGFYQIIAGERRWRAARLAGLEEIPVRVIEADDRRTAELALVEEGKLSAGHARALLPITEEKAQKAAADEVLKKSLSVRRTEQLAARQLKEKKTPETAKGPDGVDYAADVSETLSALLGRRVRLVEGRSAGRIELSFYGADDREALIAELEKFGREKAGKK